MNSTLSDILKDKFIGLLFQIISIAVGVFIGLKVDGSQEEKKEKETYNSLLKAIHVEAVYNKEIRERFAEHFNQGVIYVEFSTKTSAELVSNKIFLENASDSLIEKLSNYGLWLSRANNFRQAAERMFISAAPNRNAEQPSARNEKFALNENFEKSFRNVINNCKIEIDGVLEETTSHINNQTK